MQGMDFFFFKKASKTKGESSIIERLSVLHTWRVVVHVSLACMTGSTSGCWISEGSQAGFTSDVFLSCFISLSKVKSFFKILFSHTNKIDFSLYVFAMTSDVSEELISSSPSVELLSEPSRLLSAGRTSFCHRVTSSLLKYIKASYLLVSYGNTWDKDSLQNFTFVVLSTRRQAELLLLGFLTEVGNVWKLS